jgi:hypothetical protein
MGALERNLLACVVFLLGFFILPGFAHLNITNKNQWTIDAGPITEVITIQFGETWYNRRHDLYDVTLCFSGIFMDHFTFAPIEIGAFKAYAYNLFMNQTDFSMGGMHFEIKEAAPQHIKMSVTYPYGKLHDPMMFAAPVFIVTSIISMFLGLYLWEDEE